MKKFFVFFTLLLFCVSAFSIDVEKAVKTSVAGGRFEIAQSEIARRCTFKLDKKYGKVYQMVKTSSGGITWEEMGIVKSDYNDESKEINYQLFLSGISLSDTFLINIHSGKTWQLVENSNNKTLIWQPVF